MNQAGLISSLSRFTWNEVFFNSFQSGYLKTIDWGLYTCLESAISKRLYRFLDKRFYHSGSIDVDLKDLAFNSIGLSNEYNVAQIKRTLMRGVAELEAKWGLKALKPEDRFVKKGKGDWIVRFERRMRPSRTEIITEPVQRSVFAILEIDVTCRTSEIRIRCRSTSSIDKTDRIRTQPSQSGQIVRILPNTHPSRSFRKLSQGHQSLRR